MNLFNNLIDSGMEVRDVREIVNAIRDYGNVETLQVFYLPNERRRKWYLCNEHGTGIRTFRAYAKDCLRDAGHSAKAAALILRAALRDPIDVSNLLPVG